VQVANLQMDESALTGESVPVAKTADPLGYDPAISLGDRKNMVYAGTAASYGRGSAVVVATGMRTEFGRIAELLETIEQTKTPLQESLDRVGVMLARVGALVVVLVIAIGLVRDEPLLDMLLFGVALAVAVVPEALPAVITISLTFAAQRMVKRHALIRRLSATETLGSVSVICSDKTGTLTRNEMTVREIIAGGERFQVSGTGYDRAGEFSCDGRRVEPPEPLLEALQAVVLASDAELFAQGEDHWRLRGDPTEGALLVAAAKAGLERDSL
jgi:Ca2+-transporting ATPase